MFNYSVKAQYKRENVEKYLDMAMKYYVVFRKYKFKLILRRFWNFHFSGGFGRF